GAWLEAFEGKRHDAGVDPHESDLALRGGGVRPQGRTPVRDHHEGQGRDDQDRSPHEALLSVRCPAPRWPYAPSPFYLAVSVLNIWRWDGRKQAPGEAICPGARERARPEEGPRRTVPSRRERCRTCPGPRPASTRG